MIVRTRAAIWTVLVGVTITGCGGQDDREGVRAAFDSVEAAVAERDAGGVCAQLGPQARDQLASIGHGSSPCTTGLRPMIEDLAKRGKPGSVLAQSDLKDVDVSTTAVATIEVDGRQVKVPFVKDGDRWRLDSFYGLEPSPSVAIP